MAIQRPIRTSMWNDPRFSELDASEKLLVLHLFTNERTTLSGIYSITLRLISFETWFNIEELRKLFLRLANCWIAIYFEDLNYVYVQKFIEYQTISNVAIQTWIDRELIALNPEVWSKILEYGQHPPTLPPGWSTLLNLTLPNLTKLNSTEILQISEWKKDLKISHTGKSKNLYEEEFKQFWNVAIRKEDKQRASKNLKKVLKAGVPFEKILETFKKYNLSRKGKDPQYTKKPANWLSDWWWEDEELPQTSPQTDQEKYKWRDENIHPLPSNSEIRKETCQKWKQIRWDDVFADIMQTYNRINNQ